MTEDKFDQKIKSSLAEEMIPSEELINNTKQGVRNARKLEKRWVVFIHAIWIVLLTVTLEQFVSHLDHKTSIIIAIVIMMHLYIPIYVVIQSFLKKEYKLHDRVR
ncbi:anti-sigma factor [Bacillus luti]|uniref:Anti-sigma factor n=1 Tax=Bacillus luti TaxID=2026191 RepID=A0A7V7SC00_9BACI|nr:anti-sigma factor [Bacillus luti]KAB2445488.1 anti-sigma factor [Bacillus luti]